MDAREGRPAGPEAGARVVRVVTWNVHSCIGRDGRVSPARVADVLAALAPDVVALQEVEVGRKRTGRSDQPRALADRLGMHSLFAPALHWEDGHYGIALLSRHPLTLVRAARLPGIALPLVQPRVAVAAVVQCPEGPLAVLNTHLGLLGRERRRQVEEILGPRWLGSLMGHHPLVLCGDLNSVSVSLECTRLRTRLREGVRGDRRAATFPSHWPILRLDHILHSPDVECVASSVVRSPLARRASDHLPVVCDLAIRLGAGAADG